MKFPENLESHRVTWLQALERLVQLEPPALPGDTDDRTFWQHELAAMRVMYADLDKQKATFAAVLGAAGEAEPQIRETCNQGVGCETAGVCFARAVGEPDRCGLPVVHTKGSALPKTNLIAYEGRKAIPPAVGEFALQERSKLLAGAERCDTCNTVTARLDGDGCAKWCCSCGAKLNGNYVYGVDDQAAFEEWLARVKPAGDAESVQAQWEASSEYAEVHATKEPSDVQ
jgi:hypothetical protein